MSHYFSSMQVSLSLSYTILYDTIDILVTYLFEILPHPNLLIVPPTEKNWHFDVLKTTNSQKTLTIPKYWLSFLKFKMLESAKIR